MNNALVKNGYSAMLYVDKKGKGYDGINLVAQSFANDVFRVTGVTADITTDTSQLSGTVIIAGSISNNEFIDRLITEGKLDVSPIINKCETYRIQVIHNPTEGIKKAIVIVGSDKRGTIYGLYHLSELIGVSPWVYWADVEPPKRSELVFTDKELSYISKEPSVKYRGIFLNDEWPSLGTWTTGKNGGFNEAFYEKVFQLILRLKGNYLWPAMWSAVFSEDGKSSKHANAKLADAYGIVMGTSHHEPMFRAGEEWQRKYKDYGASNHWDFASNKEAITRFWEDGVKRNKKYENLITLGMRGEQDSALGGDIQENIDLLRSIITTQKNILNQFGLSNAPKVLTVYKEVEKFWHGTEAVAGLKKWDELKDVTIMLCDDNFGNMRTLPTKAERNREAGWGMYYHFDYHGGPVSYEWINTIPLEKVWEQMSMAYDYGVRDMWIVNVGDLKPMELPISYFLDLAYDFDSWGTNGINRIKEYTDHWVRQQFRSVGKDVQKGIAQTLADYTKMNGIRKPEVLGSSTFSHTYFHEAQTMLNKAVDLETDVKLLHDNMPDSLKDAYYQLVFYPATASANIFKMQIYAGLNKKYYELKSTLANRYAALVEEAIKADQQMQSYYNNTMANGKWQGIMSSPHVGYVNWHSEGWHYPQTHTIAPVAGAAMIVEVEGMAGGYASGTVTLPPFTNLLKEHYDITISNGGNVDFEFQLDVSDDWIKVESAKGIIHDGETIQVAVDWDLLSSTKNGVITITGAGQTVIVNVNAEVIDVSGLPHMTFVETNHMLSIEAEHTSNRVAKSNVYWQTIENYGRTLSSVKLYPTTISFINTQEAPYLEYTIDIREGGTYNLTTYTAPTNNLSNSSRLKYGVSFDGEMPVIADVLPPDFVAGDYNNDTWCHAVLENIHITTTVHRLTFGIHTLQFYGLDAGLVLQKLVLSHEMLPNSYLGPKESYYKQL